MAYKKGDNWVICDRCGFKVYRSACGTEWTGLLVCKKCFEPRHPQLLIPIQRFDKQWVEEARPRREDIFIDPQNPVTGDDL
jgi:hypothetical protein